MPAGMQTTLSVFVSLITAGCVNIMKVLSRFLTLKFKHSAMLNPKRDFHFNSKSLVFTVPEPSSTINSICQSNFDVELKKRWRAASDSGICRYQLKLETKILPGKFELVSQLNVNRATLRRRPQDMQQVNSAFDPEQFNFNKVPPLEILMKFKNEDCDDQTGEDSVLIINVSPLEFGNCLLVPRVSDNIRQKVTLDGLQLLINVMLMSTDPNLRSGFNSPGGYSSVNHQHYHLYYLEERLFLEKAQVEHLCGPCFALTSFPSKGFAFQLDDSPAKLAKDVFTLVSYLGKNNIAHNLYLTRGKRFLDSRKDSYETLRVFVWAREPAFGVKEEIGFNPALCELAGHLLIKELPNYGSVTEDVAVAMLEEVTIPWFQKVLPFINELYTPPLES